MPSIADLTLLLSVVLWPTVALVVLFSLRAPLLAVVNRATKVEVTGIKLELASKLEDAREAAEDSGLDYVFSSQNQGSASHRSLRELLISDEESTVQSHASLRSAKEAAIKLQSTMAFGETHRSAEIARASQTDASSFLSELYQSAYFEIKAIATEIDQEAANNSNPITLLQQKNVLTDNMHEILKQLRGARDLAIHSPEQTLTPGELADWSGLTLGLRQRLTQRALMLGFIEVK
jgi:hypothetical protein